MRSLRLQLVVPLLGTGLAAQAAVATAWLWQPTPAAEVTALAVLWQHGYDDDLVAECGAARVLAEVRLERARAAVPATLASGVQVGADATVAFVVVRQPWQQAATFVEALLDDPRPVADDDLRRDIARVALAADDAEFLYPGLVLQGRARQALCHGTAAARPPFGSARAIQALTPARLRELLVAPVRRRGCGMGVLPAELRERGAAWFGAAVEGVPGPPPAVAEVDRVLADGQLAAVAFEPHSRVDAPFVAAAFLAPPGPALPTFAIAVEVVRGRAAQQFRARSAEAVARAPFVSWSWLAGDPLLLLCRRGVDPEWLLPGQAAAADAVAEGEATRAELLRLLQDLRDAPPDDAEIAQARRSLRLELAIGPAEAEPELDAATAAALLPGRLQARLLADRRGIDVAAIEAVTAAAVQDVLRLQLSPGRAWWGGLLPVPRKDRGWPRR